MDSPGCKLFPKFMSAMKRVDAKEVIYARMESIPGGSPPSLDDVLEKFQLKLKGFKGGPVLILASVVVVFIIGWTAWFTVQPEETGIVQRFGKVIRTAAPGLHFKLPFGVEKVRLLPTARVLKEEFGFRTLAAVRGEKTRYASDSYKDESLMLTGDLNVINVQEKTNKNSVLILTTDSDFYQYIKQAIPGETLSLEAPVSPGTVP